jgi:hypothetical protein
MIETSKIGAKTSLTASLLFSAIVVLLHLLRNDLDPSWRFISEYEIGRHGWLMQVAFVCLAASCAGLAVAVFPYVRTIGGWIGLFFLLVSVVGMVLAAIFIPDKENKLHELGAMLDNVPFAALLINWSLSRHPGWASSKQLLALTAGLPLLGLVVFIGSLAVMLPANGGQPGPSVLAGWPNRFFVLMHLAWLVPIAWRTLRLDATSAAPKESKIASAG